MIERAAAATPRSRVGDPPAAARPSARCRFPGTRRLVAALQRHGERVFGERIAATAMPLYTDARLYGEAGVPIVLYGAGPRTILEANAKRADENLLLEDLRRATKVVAATLAELLAAETHADDARSRRRKWGGARSGRRPPRPREGEDTRGRERVTERSGRHHGSTRRIASARLRLTA